VQVNHVNVSEERLKPSHAALMTSARVGFHKVYFIERRYTFEFASTVNKTKPLQLRDNDMMNGSKLSRGERETEVLYLTSAFYI